MAGTVELERAQLGSRAPPRLGYEVGQSRHMAGTLSIELGQLGEQWKCY